MLNSRRPVLLANKARRLRKETGDDRWWAPLEQEDVGLVQRVEKILGRPLKMMFLEPMLLAINLYMSVSSDLVHKYRAMIDYAV